MPDQMLACDFFLVDTIWLTQLYVFFFIEIGSRANCCATTASEALSTSTDGPPDEVTQQV